MLAADTFPVMPRLVFDDGGSGGAPTLAVVRQALLSWPWLVSLGAGR